MVPQMNSTPAEQAAAPVPGALSKRALEDGSANIQRRGQGKERRGTQHWQALKSCRTVHCRRQEGVDNSQHPN